MTRKKTQYFEQTKNKNFYSYWHWQYQQSTRNKIKQNLHSSSINSRHQHLSLCCDAFINRSKSLRSFTQSRVRISIDPSWLMTTSSSMRMPMPRNSSGTSRRSAAMYRPANDSAKRNHTPSVNVYSLQRHYWIVPGSTVKTIPGNNGVVRAISGVSWMSMPR